MNIDLFDDLENSLELSNFSITIDSPFSRLTFDESPSSSDSFNNTFCSSKRLDYNFMSEGVKRKKNELQKLIDNALETEIIFKSPALKLSILEDLITRENSLLSASLKTKFACHFNFLLLKQNSQTSSNLFELLGIDENVTLPPITDNEKQLLNKLFNEEIKKKISLFQDLCSMYDNGELTKTEGLISDNQELLLEKMTYICEKLVEYYKYTDQSTKFLNTMLFLKMAKYTENFNNNLKSVSKKSDIFDIHAKGVKNSLIHEITRKNNKFGPAVSRLLELRIKEVERNKHILNKLKNKKAEYDKLKGTEFDDYCAEYEKMMLYMDQHAKLAKLLKKE